jgi:hypothetical protein
MNDYKKWSGDFRKKSLRLTNKAKALGWLIDPSECKFCSSNKGIHFHNEDYDVTYYTLKEVFSRKPVVIHAAELQSVRSVLIPVCRKCHLQIHKKEREEAARK